MPNLKDGAKIHSYQMIFHENTFDLMSLITCADEIYIDHMPG